MTPDQELLLENIRTDFAIVTAERKDDRNLQREILARLDRIELAVGAPLVCGQEQACRRLGFSVHWGRKHPEHLPKPISRHPIKYLIVDVEAMAAKLREATEGTKRAPRASRKQKEQPPNPAA
jgi:hypothetical protein